MIAAGIDLGGTKIEVQIFDTDWQVVAKNRVDTPLDYDDLVSAMAEQINWIERNGGGNVPVGVSAAGLINPVTGLALTANLPATGKPFPSDIEARSGRKITYVNDCRALTLSEARFGAAQGAASVAGLILGTGVGGGFAYDSRLLPGPAMVGGEFGHTAAPAHLVAQYKLPVVQCGCGRMGCIETYIAGPGLERLAQAITGETLSPPQIAAARDTDDGAAQVWSVWCEFVAELLMTLTLTFDPEMVVLGGGLSNIDGVAEDLTSALLAEQFRDFAIPKIVVAQGGDASGARGAAFAAWLESGAGDV